MATFGADNYVFDQVDKTSFYNVYETRTGSYVGTVNLSENGDVVIGEGESDVMLALEKLKQRSPEEDIRAAAESVLGD